MTREEVTPGVAEALRHLETAYDGPLSPASLAQKAGLSPARLARTIKRIHGLSPRQLITKTRITIGARLLRETARPVAEIALDCGFTDHSAFTRAFRAVAGLSPTAYRERAHQNSAPTWPAALQRMDRALAGELVFKKRAGDGKTQSTSRVEA